MSLTVGTNSWIDLADANIYMSSRLMSGKYWHTALGDSSKEAALITAYNYLVGCGLFDFPTVVSQNMKNAQCEMALFLVIHQEDMDIRLGLQSQNVSAAGIVQETYDLDRLGEIVIPPVVGRFLKVYESESSLGVIEVTRDEDEGIEN